MKNKTNCRSQQSGREPKIESHSSCRFLAKETFISNQLPVSAFQPRLQSPDVKMMFMHKIVSVPPFKIKCYVQKRICVSPRMLYTRPHLSLLS